MAQTRTRLAKRGLFSSVITFSPELTLHLLSQSACSAGDPDLVPGWEDALEKGMATHSSILAWRIPWTEEPGGLQSIGSQRVRHN